MGSTSYIGITRDTRRSSEIHYYIHRYTLTAIDLELLESGGSNHDLLESGGSNHDLLESGGSNHDLLESGGSNHDHWQFWTYSRGEYGKRASASEVLTVMHTVPTENRGNVSGKITPWMHAFTDRGALPLSAHLDGVAARFARLGRQVPHRAVHLPRIDALRIFP